MNGWIPPADLRFAGYGVLADVRDLDTCSSQIRVLLGGMMLRQFVYRNEDLVKEFLSQIEGGVFSEDQVTSRKGKAAKLGGKLGIPPMAVEGALDRTDTSEVQRRVQQTSGSEFERLYKSLEKLGQVKYVDALDFELFEELERGEILEFEATLVRAGLEKLFDKVDALRSLLPLAELFGAESLDEEKRTMMRGIELLQGVASKERVPAIATLPGEPRFKFACHLEAKWLLNSDLLEGESTILAKIQRKIRQGESYMVSDPFGGLTQSLGSELQKQLSNIFEQPETKALGLVDPSISYPGAVLTAVAIFR